ncbi:arf-GAP with SH3 domain, ANK repeat and PH domain-containing protein 1 isoform X2 [Arapaima gigas]
MRSSSSRLSSFSSKDSLWNRMPDQISVSEFLSETTEDYNSPTTSSFTTRLQSCRNTVNVLEEVRSGPSNMGGGRAGGGGVNSTAAECIHVTLVTLHPRMDTGGRGPCHKEGLRPSGAPRTGCAHSGAHLFRTI